VGEKTAGAADALAGVQLEEELHVGAHAKHRRGERIVDDERPEKKEGMPVRRLDAVGNESVGREGRERPEGAFGHGGGIAVD
jgi:hypothetical protein